MSRKDTEVKMQTVTTVPKTPDVLQLDMKNPLIASIVRKCNATRDLEGRWEFTLDIDKALAAQMLVNIDDKQRRLAKGRMTQIRRDIEKGRWENTGDPLRFSTEGTLIDGQHRLTAFCYNEKVDLLKDMTIVILKTRSALDVVDIGKSRTVNDIRRMTGRDYLPTRAIGGILFEHRDFAGRGADLSKIERNELVDNSPYLEQVKTLAANGAPTAVLAAAIRCMRADMDKGYRFFLAAVTNEHHLDGKYVSALKVLSTWLMTNTHNGGGHAIRREMVARCISAWNAYRSGKEMKSSRYYVKSDIPTAK